MQITIDISDDVLTALSFVMVDPEDWIRNAVEARADAAANAAKSAPNWNQIVAALAKNGADVSSDVAVLAAGIRDGMVQTAQQRHDIALREAASLEAPASE